MQNPSLTIPSPPDSRTNLPANSKPGKFAVPVFSAVHQALFAVMLFALTIPMTQIALGSFSAEFIAASRAVIAGLTAWVVIVINGWKRPPLQALPWLLLAGVGVVLGFPYLLSLSLTRIPAADMGVVLAGLPLVTSLLATLLQGERHPPRFWFFSVVGCSLLAGYVITTIGALPAFAPQHLLTLIATLLFGGLGYSAGAKAAAMIGGWQTICWMVVLYLPLSALVWGSLWATEAAHSNQQDIVKSMLALLYLGLISQLWGFRFWYRSLATAGVAKISQLQLLQPFFTLAFISLMLRDSITVAQLFFCALIVLMVMCAMKSAKR
ncbi:DMT family transporter [Thalassolituus alkanivorans]|uniref:DMT family transporter n=1 Tax=Thalassolituus alkanivorans TaxID=2881055 RepID=UPI001E56026D|nr:DMT family transporter [Thalassolituus alkanivorans]MCB2387428.1 DMT family transporter [Thalassolituus alkanivorans]MCB2425109.1 DMT family transporter [Thalassolituus alkanivorans]